MHSDSVLKTVIATLVAAAMAIPAPLLARDNDVAAKQAGKDSATDALPVLLEPVALKDGRTGYFIIAPYLESQEAEVVAHFAANDPKHLILGVAGPDDPALKTALASGNLAWINSYIVADASQAQAVARAPAGLRQRIKDKIKSITELCKHEKVGLITAMSYSLIVGGYVGIHSASVPAGMKAFAALFAWAGFQAVASGKWDRYLEKGGETFSKIMTWALGRDVTWGEQNFSAAVGKFHATWVANTAVAAGILAAAGESSGLNLDGFLQAMWYGFLGSTDILDAAVAQKIREGVWKQDFFKIFIVMRMVAAACFEVAAYLRIPDIQVGLASVTSFTLGYLAFRHLLDPRKRPLCEYRLSGHKPLSVANGEPAE